MDYSVLPTINAGLNTASALLLVLGYVFIRQRAITAHTLCMCAAFGTSTLFLISYITYHLHHRSTPFPGQGWMRIFYFSILISHSILAIIIVPMAIKSFFEGLRGRFDKHVKVARLTLPLWLYVSVTGVIVYVMLYRIKY